MLARGNEGVASRIKISEGAIGYVEYGFAKRLDLPVASLENKEGNYVAPSAQAGAAAISGAAHLGLEGLAASIVDPSGAEAYPIVTYSWLVLQQSYPAQKGQAINSFIGFALGEGQSVASEMGYIPLPAFVIDLGRAVVAQTGSSAGAAVRAAPLDETAPAAGRPAAAREGESRVSRRARSRHAGAWQRRDLHGCVWRHLPQYRDQALSRRA